MSEFLNALGNQITSQYLGGELNPADRTLAIVENGQKSNYARLGQFASKIDQSAQRSYLEEGYLRVNSNNAIPKMPEILMQQPTATVLVKKKMFSSLANNYAGIYMDNEEKLLMQTMIILFQNKLKKIAAYEALTKIQTASAATGMLEDQLMPFILGFESVLRKLTDAKKIANNTFFTTIDKVRAAFAYSDDTVYSRWIEDVIHAKVNSAIKYASGTGVMEFTNFTSISTGTAISSSNTTFNISMVDPYELMLVDINDIEMAINQAVNINNRPIINFGKQTLDELVAKKIGELNEFRSNRKASKIVFKINPDTIFGRRLIAIVESTGQEIIFDAKIPGIGKVEVTDPYLKGGGVLGFEGLDTGTIKAKSLASLVGFSAYASEYRAFQDAVNAIYNKIALDLNTQNNFNYAGANADVVSKINYLRKKLIFYFAGKSIIQPMDEVHIYFNGRSRYDSKVLSGLQGAFSGLGFFQKLDNNVYDIKKLFNDTLNPSGNLDFQTEKSAYGSSAIPDNLWSTIRPYFIGDKSGAHVYAGLVTGVSSSYSGGTFSIRINGQDNKHYLDMGRVNFNPGVDVFNGVLYDPLTPYVTTFDSVYSLKDSKLDFLPENKLLLGDTQHPLLLFKDGVNLNGGVTQKNVYQEEWVQEVPNGEQTPRKIFYAPDGLAYKWKEGIGILSQYGSSSNMFSQPLVGSQNITKEPFAGQDIMNTMSLLVTGQPYNFSNYYKAAIASGGVINQGGNISAASPLYILQSSIIQNNSLWGNFIPFKMLHLDDQSYQFVLQNKVQSLLNKQQKYLDTLKQLNKSTLQSIFLSQISDATAANQINPAQQAINILSQQISGYQSEFNQAITQLGGSSPNVPITIIGNDVSFDYDPQFHTAVGDTVYTDQNYRDVLKKKLNYLTHRPSWQVRANLDKNYFIVEDDIDKDYDILAFETEFKTIKLFNNEFLTVNEKIRNLASLSNLEFFCDSQGHLRVRVPQYNKMPSSVFYNMILEQKAMGYQIFPQFLLDMYYNQIDALTNKLCVAEDQIRLYCKIAGVLNSLDGSGDAEAQLFIRNTGINSQQSINQGNTSNVGQNTFTFLSDPATGDLYNFNKIFSNLTSNANLHPDQSKRNDDFLTISYFKQFIQPQLNLGNTFDVVGRLQKVEELLTKAAAGTQPPNLIDDVITKLTQRMQAKTGRKIILNDLINTQEATGTSNVIYQSVFQVDLYRITQNIAQKIVERQKTLKSLYGMVKNASEMLFIEANPTQANNLVFPSLFGNKDVPEFLKSMIEDEKFDDYGPGSGSRFRIKNSQIISYDFNESPPTHVGVTVTGRISPGFSNAAIPPPENLNNLPGGGNSMVSATAVDYDMWRQYGFRSNINSIDVPVFSDPDAQCAPYAASLLTKARKEIFRGSVTIAGNEYMQPGDVVYIEQKRMLFYVESVSHSFQQGSNFTTTLSLSFGHYPGEYIPTPMDLIGKMMYNNRDKASVINFRQASSKDEINLGAFILDPALTEPPEDTNNLGGTNYAQQNLNTLANVISKAQPFIDNYKDNPEVMVKIYLNTYFDTYQSYAAQQNNEIGTAFANQIKSLLIGQSTATMTLGNQELLKSIFLDRVVIKPVDLSTTDKRTRSPSQMALSFARDLTNKSLLNKEKNNTSSITANVTTNSSIAYNAILRKYLNRCIVDCYIIAEYRR